MHFVESVTPRFYADKRCSVDEDETDLLPTAGAYYELPKRKSSPAPKEYARKGNAAFAIWKMVAMALATMVIIIIAASEYGIVCFNRIKQGRVWRRKPAHKSNIQKRKPICHRIVCWLLLAPGLILTCSETQMVESLLVEVPSNKAVLQHVSSEPIIMPCKSDHAGRLRWLVKTYPNSNNEVLFSGYNLRKDAETYCTVMTDRPGKFQLLLKNTEEIGQTYICLEPGTLTEASADLIWIESNLACNDKSTEDLINVMCTIEFRGNWAPKMEWKEHSNDREEVLLVEVSTTTIPNKRVTSTLVTPGRIDNRSYTCTVKFDISDKPITTTATNVPNYEQSWRSSVSNDFQDQVLAESEKTAQIGAIVAVIGALLIIIITSITVGIVFFIYRRRRKGAKKEEEKKKKQKTRSLL